jgi:asparagine synthase (glutamine-hydrolysing)
MAKESSRPVNTFTVGFDSVKYDETPYARAVANQIKSKHKEISINIDAVDSLEKLLHYFDEPFADSSLIPTYYISKAAKEEVTVILSGDGGDELFGGYNWYTWVVLLTRLKKQLGGAAKISADIAKLLPEWFEGKHFLSVLNSELSHQFLERISFFSPLEKMSLYKNELNEVMAKQKSENKYLEFFKYVDGDPIEKMTVTDFYYYLPEDILTKVDRASMAVSLETRLPWLDHRLVEFAYSLPSSLKIKGKTKKYLTKELAKKLLPENFPLERKQGFCVPMNEWMRGRLGDMLQEELENRYLSEFLNKDYIHEILDKHRNHKKIDYGAKLFSILFFSMWYRRYIGKQ